MWPIALEADDAGRFVRDGLLEVARTLAGGSALPRA